MKQGSRLVTTHLLTVYLLISLRKFPLKSPVWGYQFLEGVVEDTKGTKSTCTKFTIDITDWNSCMHTSRPFPTCPSLFQLSRQLVLACKWLSHRPIRLDQGVQFAALLGQTYLVKRANPYWYVISVFLNYYLSIFLRREFICCLFFNVIDTILIVAGSMNRDGFYANFQPQ